MQTSTIQRPQLFTQFFDTEIMWNNEYLTYIKTSIHKATMKVTSTLRDFTIKTKNQLKVELKNLSKLSENLFKTYSENVEECKEVDKKISQIYKDYKNAPDLLENKSDFPIEITTNKPYKENKIGDLVHYYEIESTWTTSLASAIQSRNNFLSSPELNSLDLDFNIYYIEKRCVSNNRGNIVFESVSKVLVD